MGMQEDVATVQAVYQAFGAGDLDTLLGYIDDQVDWWWFGPDTIPWAGQHLGKDAVARFFGSVGGYAEVEVYDTREFLPGDGGVVTVLGWQRINVPATGKTWETNFAHVFHLRDGRITRAREYYDTAPIVAALQP